MKYHACLWKHLSHKASNIIGIDKNCSIFAKDFSNGEGVTDDQYSLALSSYRNL